MLNREGVGKARMKVGGLAFFPPTPPPFPFTPVKQTTLVVFHVLNLFFKITDLPKLAQ